MPVRFQFRLENVLRIKEKFEEQLAIELKKSQTRLAEELDKLNQYIRQKEEFLSAAELGGQEMAPLELRVQTSYINQLRHRIEDQRKAVKKAEIVVDKDRTKLLKASQEKKAVEKLREKQLENYQREMSHKELTLNSEIALRMQNEQSVIGDFK